MIFKQEKKVKKLFMKQKTDLTKLVRVSVKNKCFMVAFIQKLEYAQSLSGRCISYRSRRNGMDSIVIRNKKFGTEVRFILNNPRFILIF
jgi:hypothetical protein